MKRASILIVILILICHPRSYSQAISKKTKEHHLRVKKNSKGLSLKIKNVKPVEKNGKVSWEAKAILKNKTRDTLFYFVSSHCEPSLFLVMAMADTISLFTDFERCDENKQVVISVSPKEKRTIDLLISSARPVKTSFKFIVFLYAYKAKNNNELNSDFDLMRKEGDREIWLQSNRVKT